MLGRAQGLRLIAEKVVHHPTIIAGHAEGRGWTIDADTELRSKFWGRSMDLIPVGSLLFPSCAPIFTFVRLPLTPPSPHILRMFLIILQSVWWRTGMEL